MNLDQMAELCAFLSLAMIKFHIRDGGWMTADQKRIAFDEWLAQRGGKASWYKLARLVLVADQIARQALVEYPERIREIISGESIYREDEFYYILYQANKNALLEKNITR